MWMVVCRWQEHSCVRGRLCLLISKTDKEVKEITLHEKNDRHRHNQPNLWRCLCSLIVSLPFPPFFWPIRVLTHLPANSSFLSVFPCIRFAGSPSPSVFSSACAEGSSDDLKNLDSMLDWNSSTVGTRAPTPRRSMGGCWACPHAFASAFTRARWSWSYLSERACSELFHSHA